MCPECGSEKTMKAYVLANYGFACDRCSDGISVPEKFAISVLTQLGIEFKTQLSKSTFAWVKNKKYDFYFKINEDSYIMEVHGEQHYIASKGVFNNLKKEQENDEFKKELALANGIKEENYIVVDCRYSKLEWMKNNFVKSLENIIDTSNINWEEAFEYTNSNLSIMIRDRWNNRGSDEFIMASDMNREFGITRAHRYLNFWTKIGKCDYNPKDSLKYIAAKNGEFKYKKVQIIDKNEITIGVYNSVSDAIRDVYDRLNIKLNAPNISRTANTEKYYKGFKFKYI